MCSSASSTSFRDKVSKAEGLWCKFVGQPNIAFAVADCVSDLVKEMFPDSKIAKEFACKRIKTVAVITEALAPDVIRRTVGYAVNGPVSLMVDESKDINSEKSCAIVLSDKH